MKHRLLLSTTTLAVIVGIYTLLTLVPGIPRFPNISLVDNVLFFVTLTLLTIWIWRSSFRPLHPWVRKLIVLLLVVVGLCAILLAILPVTTANQFLLALVAVLAFGTCVACFHLEDRDNK